jgi:hypothetical protein
LVLNVMYVTEVHGGIIILNGSFIFERSNTQLRNKKNLIM